MRQLKARINEVDFAVGDRLPSEIEWAKTLGVSRNRTRQALRELELEGLIVRKQGSGSFVAPRPGPIPISTKETAEKTVGIVFPRHGSRYFQEVLSGFFQYMSGESIATIAYNIQPDSSSEPGFLEAICENGFCGLAIWLEGITPEARQVLHRQCDRRFPIVMVDRSLEDLDVDSVISDNVEIGKRLTKALIDRGHKRIAFLGTRRVGPTSIAGRCAGYRQALEEASIDLDERLVIDMARFWESPPDIAREVLSLRDRPTGIVCIHDGAAMRFHTELAALGYQVPEHAELAAVDDYSYDFYSEPVPFWALAQNGHTIGVTAAELLVRRIAHPDTPTEQHLIQPGIITHTEYKIGEERVLNARKGGVRLHETTTAEQ